MFTASAAAPRGLRERFLAPLCILGKMFAPFHGVNICVWRKAPNTGGVAALATINDGTSSLIEGELDFCARRAQKD